LTPSTIHIHQDLIEGCRKNNRKAQMQLYGLYCKALYNTAYRILGHTAEAEDAMQEAFLSGFEKIGEYKGDATIGAWLKSIVINKALDQIRKRKEMLSLEDIEQEPVADDPAENYLETLAYRIGHIRQGIERLEEDDRIILSLFLLEGYDHEEISQVLGISNNASRTRYSRARQRLRELLREKHTDHMLN
jgi:RNA polymerase sigma factor (sigma-70 family)